MTSGRTSPARALLAVLTAALCLSAATARAAEAILDVKLDRAKIFRMPEKAETIVIGNPIIADVTTLKGQGLVVVTGKGYGETNMVFLDAAGAEIQEATVRVSAAASLLTVQRGMDRESYACHPRCEPTVALGDATNYLHDASGQITARNTLATPGAH